MIAFVALCLAFVLWLDIGKGQFMVTTMLVFVPVAALITVLNIKLTKFCDNCGATLYNQNRPQKMEYCSQCGNSLLQTQSVQ